MIINLDPWAIVAFIAFVTALALGRSASYAEQRHRQLAEAVNAVLKDVRDFDFSFEQPWSCMRVRLATTDPEKADRWWRAMREWRFGK